MEKIGQINSYRCVTCGWCTLTINLDPGTTPFTIRCLGDQTKNPNDPKNVVLGEHLAESGMYRPQGWWATSKHGLVIERAWIRPTLAYLKSTLPEEENLEAHVEHFLNGGLLLVSLKETVERARNFPEFGENLETTQLYLKGLYDRN